MVPVDDFNRHKPDFDEFQDLVKRSDTLAQTVAQGWTIVHVEFTRDEYHVIILERGKRSY